MTRWIPGVSDLVQAIGPLITAAIFLAMLYGLMVPINELVYVAINLVYWPFYTMVAVLVDVGLTAMFRHQDPNRWQMFRNGFFPGLLVLSILFLFIAGSWFWLIVFCQCLHLVSSPPDDEEYREGCLSAAILAVMLLFVGLTVTFGGAVTLSQSFNFPNTSGDFRYLPGMLILGTGFYGLLSLVALFREIAVREISILMEKQAGE